MLLGDQPQGLALADGRVALMVREDEFDPSAAEPRQARRGGQRQIGHLRVGLVDDLRPDLDRRLGRLTGRPGVPAQGQEDSDLHGSRRAHGYAGHEAQYHARHHQDREEHQPPPHAAHPSAPSEIHRVRR